VQVVPLSCKSCLQLLQAYSVKHSTVSWCLTCLQFQGVPCIYGVPSALAMRSCCSCCGMLVCSFALPCCLSCLRIHCWCLLQAFCPVVFDHINWCGALDLVAGDRSGQQGCNCPAAVCFPPQEYVFFCLSFPILANNIRRLTSFVRSVVCLHSCWTCHTYSTLACGSCPE
jgi:hypothetical protein